MTPSKIFIFSIVIGAMSAVIMHMYIKEIDPVVVAILPDGGRYSGDMFDGVLHGNGEIQWKSGASYSGQFENGLAQGKGRYVYADGSIYEGQFTSGMLSGFGTLTDPSDGVYEGEFKADRMTGVGRWVTKSFDYQGTLKNSQFNGEGDINYPDGSRYIGSFNLGQYHGAGVYTGPFGDVYSGQFENGQLTGDGFYTSADLETQYTGRFKDWFYHGSGTYSVKNGDTYTGTFVEGSLSGSGQYLSKTGGKYTGHFNEWLYHGEGKYISNDGDIFEGEFKNGYYDGEGKIFLADTIDGISEYTGVWNNGRLIESSVADLVYDPKQVLEELLYSQNNLLEEKLNAIAANDPNKQELYFVGISGDGSQEVFRRETLYVNKLFNQKFNRENQSVMLINSRKTFRKHPLATKFSIKKTFDHVAKKMDPDNDILFIYLTSHGSKDHQFYLNQQNLPLSDYSAEELGRDLKNLNIKNKVVVVSACYSGGFIPMLDDGETIIITAAKNDKTSFGCADRNEFTYFGEAFFKEGVAKGLNFVQAFENATQLISLWEEEGGIAASEPQILKPEKLSVRINTWFDMVLNQKRRSVMSAAEYSQFGAN